MDFQTISIKDYLTRKGIEFAERNGELVTKCLFNNCDADSTGSEAHLYFAAETGLYDCKKCGEKGNIVTLAKHLGDDLDSIALNPRKKIRERKAEEIPFLVAGELLPSHIRQYLNKRGIPDEIINKKEAPLMYGNVYGKYWIAIPVLRPNGESPFSKLRKDPNDPFNPVKYKVWPQGSEAELYGWQYLKNNKDMVVICEGEFDAMVLHANGIPAVTSTAGAGTFKEEWVERFKDLEKIYICLDKDDAGERGVERIVKLFEKHLPKIAIYKTTLPDRMTDGKDITDYFVKYGGNPDELISELSKQVGGKNSIDVSKFSPLTSEELLETLGLTIKHDQENKLATFLCELSAYTEDSQFNVSYNAPSSTGKSYIPTEIARLFPEDDVMEIGYCTPTAFFHDVGEYNKEKNTYLVDLSHKILIFLDQPHTQLLERLRPLLSHDKKEIQIKITDKTQKMGLKTKNVLLRGFPAVIFCTAALKTDEQEMTRFLLLSPEVSQEKIREGVSAIIRREADAGAFARWLEEKPDRILLKERIRAIKLENILEIKLASQEKIEKRFLTDNKMLKPRHQRDIKRLISLVKSFALLNLWWRERDGSTIIANDEDIESAFKLWSIISVSQELNLPPYIYNLYQDVILAAWNEKNLGGMAAEPLDVSRPEIHKKHYEVYGRMLSTDLLCKQILPMLETAGLITQDQDPTNKRKILVHPVFPTTKPVDQGNSGSEGGVNTNEQQNKNNIVG